MQPFYAILDRRDWPSVEETQSRALRTIEGVVRRYADLTDNEMQRLFRLPKSGNRYVRDGWIHVASAPGEPPAVDTGHLSRSINARYMRAGMTREVNVGVDNAQVPYAEKLEFGVRGFPARPFAEPTTHTMKARFFDSVTEAVIRSLQRSATR